MQKTEDGRQRTEARYRVGPASGRDEWQCWTHQIMQLPSRPLALPRALLVCGESFHFALSLPLRPKRCMPLYVKDVEVSLLQG